MLGSITPLGERGRGQNYLVTITFFLVGSVAAGACVGAGLGALGQAVGSHGSSVPLAGLAGLLVLGLGFDLGVVPRALPSPRRQVDETWLVRYRGWVYGIGFGFQLGLGVATIVTVSAVYVVLAAAFLSGSVGAGLAIGAVFGLARWACAAAGFRVRGPAALARSAGRIAQLDRPAWRVTLAAQVAAVAAAVAVLVA